MDARCRSCGLRFEVGARQVRRIRSEESSGVCGRCRSAPGRVEPTDADYRYWATRFGVEVPKGRSAREALATGAIPDELAEIIAGFRQRE